MIEGINKADLNDNRLHKLYILLSEVSKELEDISTRPCVFLSHKREDKPECRKIAEYFKKAEIDYYLDELDDSLQKAAQLEDPKLITESLKKGIRESSHMLVVVSEKTSKSQWVPFEVGYGHFAILDKSVNEGVQDIQIKLAILILEDLSEKTLPDYMQTAFLIKGVKTFNEYIAMISGEPESSLVNEKRIFSATSGAHPLAGVLNMKL